MDADNTVYGRNKLLKYDRIKFMKKCFKLTALTLLASALILVSFSLGIVIFTEKNVFAVNSEVSYSPADESQRKLSKNAVLEPVSVTQCDDTVYIIREYNGKIGVFRHGTETPERILDIYVFTLPENIAKELSSGIECDSRTAEIYIEAFTS